jgi:hypothetical protein
VSRSDTGVRRRQHRRRRQRDKVAMLGSGRRERIALTVEVLVLPAHAPLKPTMSSSTQASSS